MARDLCVSVNHITGVTDPLHTIYRAAPREILYAGFGTRATVMAKFTPYYQRRVTGVSSNDDVALEEAHVPLRELEGYDLFYEGAPLQMAVWGTLRKVGPGEIVTYGGLAALSGVPAAARAVGTAMNRNPISYYIPCHRVVKKQGDPWAYGWGCDVKRELLVAEGVTDPRAPPEAAARKRAREVAPDGDADSQPPAKRPKHTLDAEEEPTDAPPSSRESGPTTDDKVSCAAPATVSTKGVSG